MPISDIVIYDFSQYINACLSICVRITRVFTMDNVAVNSFITLLMNCIMMQDLTIYGT